MPEITVIVPTYNVAPWLADTLRSVREQSFTDFLCIVVDDGSTDNTAEVFLRSTGEDPRFRLVQRQHGGVCAARNAGISLVETPFVSMLDGDDIWHPLFLERMLGALTSAGARVAWCHFAMFFDGTCVRKPQFWTNSHATGNIWWDMLLDAVFCMGAWAAKTDDVRAVGGFNTSLAIAEDRDFLLRLLANCLSDDATSAVCVPDELLFYRQRRGSAVRSTLQRCNSEWEIMCNHLELPGVPSAVRGRGYSFLAFKMAVIASCAHRDLKAALRWYCKAVALCPTNMNLYLLPLRKIILKLAPAKRLPWLCDFLFNDCLDKAHVALSDARSQ